MLTRRLRRRTNITPALGECNVFVEYYRIGLHDMHNNYWQLLLYLLLCIAVKIIVLLRLYRRNNAVNKRFRIPPTPTPMYL